MRTMKAAVFVEEGGIELREKPAFRAALFDAGHHAILERFDMQVGYLRSEDCATEVRRRYEEEREMVERLGLGPG
jgi:hypothetical protein